MVFSESINVRSVEGDHYIDVYGSGDDDLESVCIQQDDSVEPDAEHFCEHRVLLPPENAMSWWSPLQPYVESSEVFSSRKVVM